MVKHGIFTPMKSTYFTDLESALYWTFDIPYPRTWLRVKGVSTLVNAYSVMRQRWIGFLTCCETHKPLARIQNVLRTVYPDLRVLFLRATVGEIRLGSFWSYGLSSLWVSFSWGLPVFEDLSRKSLHLVEAGIQMRIINLLLLVHRYINWIPTSANLLI